MKEKIANILLILVLIFMIFSTYLRYRDCFRYYMDGSTIVEIPANCMITR